MKSKIHPEYMRAQVVCSCGNTWETGSTKPLLKVELCSQCHPFYTGEHRIVDTAGRVERFNRRYNRTMRGVSSPEPAEAQPS